MSAQRVNQTQELRDNAEKIEGSHRRQLLGDERRREKINKRLLVRSRDLEKNRKELETARTMLEGLDFEQLADPGLGYKDSKA